jgi:hypothetical protein
MNTDRELLELAARAAGFKLHRWMGDLQNKYLLDPNFDSGLAETWNPLNDDGDALRLAVKLNMHVMVSAGATRASWNNGIYGEVVERDKSDQLSATRRAIVRAAAAIGETMQ